MKAKVGGRGCLEFKAILGYKVNAKPAMTA